LKFRRLLLLLPVLGFLWAFIPQGANAGSVPSQDFWIVCPYTGITATVDPIVDPGSTTTAHFHDFYGNTTINENSTPASLQAAGAGATSCTTATDTAAYWAPELLLQPNETQTYGPPGAPCTTLASGLQACHYAYIRAYYSNGSVPVSNLPFGMSTVGGNSDATGVQPMSQVTFSCGSGTPFETHPYSCAGHINLATGNDGIVARAIMPRCWNGQDATNRANFHYPPCAASDQVLPVVNVRFHTGIVSPCPGSTCAAGNTQTPAFGFRNADDSLKPWYQFHADFMNGWQYGDSGTSDNMGGVDDLVQDCLISALACPPNPHTTPHNNMPT